MNTRIHGWALLALLMQGCGTQETTLRLSVVYDDAWALSDFEVTTPERSARVDAAHEVLLTLSDVQAGRELAIEIVGLRGEARYAAGRVVVTPIRGAETAATLALTRTRCGAWCTEGTRACDTDGFVVCEVQPDGCMAWSARAACTVDEPYCSFGVCGAECVDECAAEERRCAGPDATEVCGQRDSDPCFEWMPPTDCADGETCSFGSCLAVCRDECEEGAVTCRDGGLSTCADDNLDGCTEWGPTVSCPSGESCEDAACIPFDECTNQCAESVCAGAALTECGNFDLDPCLELSPGISCQPTEPCMEGSCEMNRCVALPRVCDEPPPSRCVDGHTLETFSRSGTCAERGCEYHATRTSCPEGCRDGLCLGSVCAPGVFDIVSFDDACFQ
jgi:hypothetical protein